VVAFVHIVAWDLCVSGCILVAERRFPAEFDWRYMTLSTLISPHRNPNGYVWAAGGLVLSALSALFWAVVLARRWNGGNGERPRGIWLLEWGSVCMVFSVMLPWRLPRLPKEHEVLTLFAFAGLCLGMIRLGYHTAEETLGRRAAVQHGACACMERVSQGLPSCRYSWRGLPKRTFIMCSHNCTG
jgi:hypothetical protein